MVMSINSTYCGGYFATYTDIESLCYAPEIDTLSTKPLIKKAGSYVQKMTELCPQILRYCPMIHRQEFAKVLNSIPICRSHFQYH